MPPRWNTWATVRAVQLDYEKTRTSRLGSLERSAPIFERPTASVVAYFLRTGVRGGITGTVRYRSQIRAAARSRRLDDGPAQQRGAVHDLVPGVSDQTAVPCPLRFVISR